MVYADTAGSIIHPIKSLNNFTYRGLVTGTQSILKHQKIIMFNLLLITSGLLNLFYVIKDREIFYSFSNF